MIPSREYLEFDPEDWDDPENKFSGDFPEVPYYIAKKRFYVGLLETFRYESEKRLKENLLGILIYGIPGENIEDIPKRDVDIAVVTKEDYPLEKAKRELSKVREIIETHEENEHNVKIDGVVFPKKEYERRLRRIIGIAPLPVEIADIDSWLSQHAKTHPTFLLVPYYQRNNYLVNQIEYAKKNPIKEVPRNLDDFRF